MLRKMLRMITLTGLLLPVGVFALGLGDVDLRSYLNQPLKAEIEILSIDSSELANLKVRLASPAEFEKAKIEFQPNLESLRLSIAKKTNGKSYIIISSSSSFKEPYLNVLVEVVWSNGRILREYALLIDPPLIAPNTNRQIATKPESESPPETSVETEAEKPKETTAEKPKETEVAENTDLGFPKEDAAKGDKTAAGENPYKEPEASAAVAKNDSAADFEKEQDKYPRIPVSIDNKSEGINTAKVDDSKESAYRVNRGDTMMQIARQFRSNASLHQTMMAIKKANPNAFINNNVHLVKANAQLVIPDSATIEALSNSDALQQYQAQTEMWRQSDTAPVTVAKAKVENTGAREGVFDLKPPNEDDKVDGLSDTANMSKNDGKVSSGGSDNADLEKVKTATENEDWESQAVKAKNEMLKTIEEKNKRIIDIKSSSLTLLSKRAEMRKYCEGNETDRNCFKADGFQPVDLDSLENKGKDANPPFNQYDDAGGVGAKLVTLTKKWFTYLKENPLVTAIAAGFALFSIIIVFLIIRQHRRARSEFEESILEFEEDTALRGNRATPVAGVQTSNASVPTSTMSTFGSQMQPESATQSAVNNESQSSYLSDFVVSGMDDLNSGSGESDPLTEADVFFAYGKYEAAEMLIKEAIQNEPNRLDLRYKLLDIYHGSKNKGSFEFEASELYDMVKNKQDPNWLRVVEMGRDLAPDNAQFSDGSSVPVTAAVPPSTMAAASVGNRESADDFDLDFDFDVSDKSDNGLEKELSELTRRADRTENVVSFNPSDNSIADFASSDAGDYENSGFLSDVDEVGTKLDLAKAYIDMGDPEGARSILDEVLEEGNEKQKGEAQDLMQQMAS